jgi:NADPH:quinone reductase-like Zn-dependent oxidoreductase
VTFKALLATRDGEKISTDLVELEEKDLMSGDVTIAVDYSTVNYKDGVAAYWSRADLPDISNDPGYRSFRHRRSLVLLGH